MLRCWTNCHLVLTGDVASSVMKVRSAVELALLVHGTEKISPATLYIEILIS
jgi:hypothetical protein